jgi:hypothetical protein
MREGPAKFVGPFFAGRSSKLRARCENLAVGAGKRFRNEKFKNEGFENERSQN